MRMKDKCDPPTFNAAAGPGTCVGDGNITFAQFIRELTSAKRAGAWHFDPAAGTVDEGTVLALENRGGETHTFTKVENFGCGFVAPLNELSGNPVPAPECATATLGGLVPKPAGPGNIFVGAGTTEVGPTARGHDSAKWGNYQVPVLYSSLDAGGTKNAVDLCGTGVLSRL